MVSETMRMAGLDKFFQQRLGAVLGEQHAADGADHADLGVRLVAQLVEGVEVVLGGQASCMARSSLRRPAPQIAQSRASAAVHQGVGAGRLVRAVEAADADVDDALAQLRGVVGRAGDSGRQQGRCCRLSFIGGFPLAASGRLLQSFVEGLAVAIEQVAVRRIEAQLQGAP